MVTVRNTPARVGASIAVGVGIGGDWLFFGAPGWAATVCGALGGLLANVVLYPYPEDGPS